MKEVLIEKTNFVLEYGGINALSPDQSFQLENDAEKVVSSYLHFCLSFLSEQLLASDKSVLIEEVKNLLKDEFYSVYQSKGTLREFIQTIQALEKDSPSAKFLNQYDAANNSDLRCKVVGFFENFSVKFENPNIILKLNSYLEIEVGTYLLTKSISHHDSRLDLHFRYSLLSSIIKSLNLSDGNLQASEFPFINTLEEIVKQSVRHLREAERLKIGPKEYNELVSSFARKNDLYDEVDGLYSSLILFQNAGDKESIKYLEKLVIKTLGHWESDIAEEAVTLINMIYDGTNFQEKSALETVVRRQQDELTAVFTFNFSSLNETVDHIKTIKCITSRPNPLNGKSYNISIIPPTRIEVNKISGSSYKTIFSFLVSGKSKYCGYYDYQLIKFNSKAGNFINEFSSKLTSKSINTSAQDNYQRGSYQRFYEESHYRDETVELSKGRFVVINKEVDELSIHEVFTDQETLSYVGNTNQTQQPSTVRSNFNVLATKITEYKEKHINCLYVMGALERDNQLSIAKSADPSVRIITKIGNVDASPMATTCRSTISSLLGGDKAFVNLLNVASANKVKILVDCLARISSSRHHKRYRDLLLNSLDDKGKLNYIYGADGYTVNYEDTAMLNYRKQETWDCLVDDVLSLLKKYNVDGIHLDNSQTWPNIYEINKEEMLRIDIDGTPAYTDEQILSGKIVLPNEEAGFWTTDRADHYPNPLLVKLTREIWKVKPDFIFVGECWSNKEKYKQRHVTLLKCGIIPRLYSLPRSISMVLGRRIHRNGYIEPCKPENVSIIKTFLSDNYNFCPRGSRIIQSSSGQVWPYPALLYSRGNWAAIDLLFTIMDVPMTFMNEIYGEAFRVKINSIYEKYEIPNVSKMLKSGKSNTSLKEEEEKIKSKGDVKFHRMPSMLNSNDPNITTSSIKKSDDSPNQKKIPQISSRHSLKNISSTDLENTFKNLGSVTTEISLSAVSKDNVNQIKVKQEELSREVGPEYGFDLNKIQYHYNHRRLLRESHECLKSGDLIFLNVTDESGQPHPFVLAYARQSEEEKGIIIINFSFNISYFKIDFSEILKDKAHNNKTVCFIQDWQTDDDQGHNQLLCEILSENNTKNLLPFKSQFFSLKVLDTSEHLFKETLKASISRMVSCINAKTQSTKLLDNFYLTIKLKEIVQAKHIEKFTLWLCFMLEIFKKYKIQDSNKYFSKVSFLFKNESLVSKFIKSLYIVQKAIESEKPEMDNDQAKQRVNDLNSIVQNIINKNKLGPIVFVTPELGRWSTVGGLGVMVDELSQGLASEGREVIMITPYYDKNRKGETGYLKTDPAGFVQLEKNILIHLDDYYSFGVHYGVVNGVKIYFLHNYTIFPIPYPDGTADFTVRQIACFSKASLELLCSIKCLPDIILTNDWFTGLVAAYSKNGHFGDYFKNSSFFHICHNLEPSYEGRLYPSHGVSLLIIIFIK